MHWYRHLIRLTQPAGIYNFAAQGHTGPQFCAYVASRQKTTRIAASVPLETMPPVAGFRHCWFQPAWP
ncbi:MULTISPECIES: hypothetical protein [Bradyrhizobium]|jgi:hypothetical protein|uniref:hypothetical protein n=1 Tax=Bradyrhizobium TaxID=374 RepID=UPI00035F5853|nr:MULTISPECIES: hypothetical protein [Bradyrhizobium]MCP1728945.1 hypothetical protein [Bradyrhizobium elkanii]MCS3573071.1 hypothetical protein [Bradyrhizobium elkanii]MCS3594237.1 hypothetical protein [Bradyrhizobium elkanii]MCS3623680.1 hypothetical protein [Bradyrhizobium elkanii]MCW2117192.1 hypothetical protein [Bradyrhizobium elkanii]